MQYQWLFAYHQLTFPPNSVEDLRCHLHSFPYLYRFYQTAPVSYKRKPLEAVEVVFPRSTRGQFFNLGRSILSITSHL